ncbi:MAG: chaperone modulator CbpM [Microthrixaceae bacterium]
MTSDIEPAERIEFEVFARVCDLHPELVERLVALGLLEAASDDEGRLWFDRRQVAEVGRIRRLRSGLRLSYSAIPVVAELIDRIDELETELMSLGGQRRRPPTSSVTRTVVQLEISRVQHGDADPSHMDPSNIDPRPMEPSTDEPGRQEQNHDR